MSKLIDRIIAEAIFHKEKPVMKEKKSKYEKLIEEEILKSLAEDLRKKLEKKEEKKEEKKGPWEKLSVVQKLTILMITVPIALMLETIFILKLALMIGWMVHQ